jgi:acyl-CoA synthetase (NDP forming)
VSEHEAKRILREYGIDGTREELAGSKADACTIAARIGYPVALKVQSPDVPHKTEAGGLRLGVRSDAELERAYDEILRNVAAYQPGARIEGVLVQEMTGDAIEVILGVINKPQFGPAIMFGLGGIFAEVLGDVSFRFSPITPDVAFEMVKEIRGYPILAGARGRPHADVEALVDAIVKLSLLAIDLKDVVAELDINPLFVGYGRGIKAGDALIKLVDSHSNPSAM